MINKDSKTSAYSTRNAPASKSKEKKQGESVTYQQVQLQN